MALDEGIVAKPKRAYQLTRERSPWVKVKNADYSQARDGFETRTRRRRVAT
jgi:ATP-dependent DNA ligase